PASIPSRQITGAVNHPEPSMAGFFEASESLSGFCEIRSALQTLPKRRIPFKPNFIPLYKLRLLCS
ncbi:hypothetical protein, partial [Pseudaminobacter sp. NGMCC 1.201702]|uniref:hypothetical protein n=1 Tax=Pseudaminobacter sp. NGMCC 1.201702 TaxID=3391825 RepID=UPI0039EE0B3D